MLPIITEEVSTEIFGEVFQDMQSWRKNMVQYLKEVALGAYLSYRLIEVAAESDGLVIEE